jgi:hypothetical protein
MYVSPSRKECFSVLSHNGHRAAHFVSLHIRRPDQLGRSAPTCQVDLGVPITEDMHVGRFVVIAEDNDAQPMRAMNGDHERS